VGEEFVGGWSAGFEVDGEDVEAGIDVAIGQLAHVVAGETAQDATLVFVDGQIRGSDGARGARLDLDEAERVRSPFRAPGNQVQVSAGARGAPAAGDDGVSLALEPEESGTLAAVSGIEVRRAGRPPASCAAVEGLDKRLEKMDAELAKPGHWIDCRANPKCGQGTKVTQEQGLGYRESRIRDQGLETRDQGVGETCQF
jgi:hypothetical protein